MLNIYETLKTYKYYIDNEYLIKYAQLIERNRRTPVRGKQTHKHHIVPKSWFKLTEAVINNDLNNLVNLPIREHILAHYYLCLCTEDPFRFANQLALVCLQTQKRINSVDLNLLHNLPMYNYIYEDYVLKLQQNYKLYGEH